MKRKIDYLGGFEKSCLFLVFVFTIFLPFSMANAMTVGDETEDGNKSEKSGILSYEEVEKEVDRAKFSLERNQTRFKIVNNLIANTIEQLDLDESETERVREYAEAFKVKVNEIEVIYEGYLKSVSLYANKKGPNPGRIEEVFVRAKEKKASLMDFYKNTFRVSLEKVLTKNEKINKK